MFPYFHMCDIELQRELPHVHNTYGVGVGAFVCEGVEALGHDIKVAAFNYYNYKTPDGALTLSFRRSLRSWS